MFNQPEYREGVKARKDVSAGIMGVLGLGLTLASGGAALPLGALLMAPAAARLLENRNQG
jgi:hypothetical protein